jgi:hypothetical protein
MGVGKKNMEQHHSYPPLTPPTKGGEFLVEAFMSSGSVKPIRGLHQRWRV